MPQAYDSLRRKFMKNGSDGILEAETILKEGGFTINKGVITFPEFVDNSKHTNGELSDAMTFLCQEWDYCNA